MIRRTVLVAAATAALILAPTAAMAYDAPGYTSTVSDLSPRAGTPISVAINGLQSIAGKQIDLTITSVPSSIPNSSMDIAGTKTFSKTADASGDAAFTVTLREAGTYNVVAIVDGKAIGTQSLAVGAVGTTGAAAGTTAGSSRARTSFDGVGLAAGAGVLVLAGIGAGVVAKRRQGASTTTTSARGKKRGPAAVAGVPQQRSAQSGGRRLPSQAGRREASETSDSMVAAPDSTGTDLSPGGGDPIGTHRGGQP